MIFRTLGEKCCGNKTCKLVLLIRNICSEIGRISAAPWDAKNSFLVSFKTKKTSINQKYTWPKKRSERHAVYLFLPWWWHTLMMCTTTWWTTTCWEYFKKECSTVSYDVKFRHKVSAESWTNVFNKKCSLSLIMVIKYSIFLFEFFSFCTILYRYFSGTAKTSVEPVVSTAHLSVSISDWGSDYWRCNSQLT